MGATGVSMARVGGSDVIVSVVTVPPIVVMEWISIQVVYLQSRRWYRP